MKTEVRYCANACHDFTDHNVRSSGRAQCQVCTQYVRCSTCRSFDVPEHVCPAPDGREARLYCTYCEMLRTFNRRSNGRWQCHYCAETAYCNPCNVYWTVGHQCTSGSGQPLKTHPEVTITIAPGIEMSLLVPRGGETRVRALGPRLHAGPTFRKPVESAVLAMDRAVRAGDDKLALDLLVQAESLAEAG